MDRACVLPCPKVFRSQLRILTPVNSYEFVAQKRKTSKGKMAPVARACPKDRAGSLLPRANRGITAWVQPMWLHPNFLRPLPRSGGARIAHGWRYAYRGRKKQEQEDIFRLYKLRREPCKNETLRAPNLMHFKR